MFKFLFLIFVVVPIVEIYVLLQVGGQIGALPTVGLVVLTAVLGAIIIRIQGLVTLMRFREKMSRGEMPAEEMVTGMALLVAGAFLMTPGFVTDSMGFLLLVPAFRRYMMKEITKRGVFAVHAQGTQFHSSSSTLEGEFRKED